MRCSKFWRPKRRRNKSAAAGRAAKKRNFAARTTPTPSPPSSLPPIFDIDPSLEITVAGGDVLEIDASPCGQCFFLWALVMPFYGTPSVVQNLRPFHKIVHPLMHHLRSAIFDFYYNYIYRESERANNCLKYIKITVDCYNYTNSPIVSRETMESS